MLQEPTCDAIFVKLVMKTFVISSSRHTVAGSVALQTNCTRRISPNSSIVCRRTREKFACVSGLPSRRKCMPVRRFYGSFVGSKIVVRRTLLHPQTFPNITFPLGFVHFRCMDHRLNPLRISVLRFFKTRKAPLRYPTVIQSDEG